MVVKNQDAIRFGLLGTSRIAVNAMINPGKSHTDVVVAAVASRDQARVDRYAKQHSIATTYAGSDAYQSQLPHSGTCIY